MVRVDGLGFSDEFNDAVTRLLRGADTTVEQEQQRLRALIPALGSEQDRTWASGLVEGLPREVVPVERSALYREALARQAAAYETSGSDPDRLAALDEARTAIWGLADRADPDEQADIRALTRMLDQVAEHLRDQVWSGDGAD